LFIVDSQIHIWAAESRERPWPAGRAREAQRRYPVPPESLLLQMDQAGVARAVLVPPSWEGDRNDLALEAAANYPGRFAVMGRFDPRDPRGEEAVAAWRSQLGMLGMRFTFHNEHNRHLLTDGSMDWLWTAAERSGVPLMVFVPGSLGALANIAERHPGLRLVIDHAGLNLLVRGPEVFEDTAAVCELARFPNIAVKASGIPSFSSEPYPWPDTHDLVRRLFESFGPRRTFWGTDLTRMRCTYYECIRQFTDHFDWLRGEDLEWVIGKAVCEWLGWPHDEPTA
jgi:predicted TIM-barrel fold metal-dependent hydrolase